MTAPVDPRGPVPLAERVGGPDLARGLALLGIAVANVVGWLHGREWTVLLKQADTGPVDRLVDVLVAVLVDNRGFPLFALLFGYGLGILHRRSVAAGESRGRFRVRMVRRMAVLGLIGVLHGILLFDGDILVGYAVIGTLLALLLGARRTALPVAALVALPFLAGWGWQDGVIGLSGGDGYPSAAADGAAEAITIRVGATMSALAFAPVQDLGLLTPMAIGAIAARSRLLEDAAAHARLLRALTRWGLAGGVIGALPLAAVLLLDPHLRTLTSPGVLGGLGVLHQLTGVAGAVGVAAGCALLAARAAAGGRAARVTGALSALGATALTAYLLQSVLASLLFPASGLDLGDRIGSAGASALVAGGWAASVVLAALWRRTGRRGPAEAVLRVLADPPRRSPGGVPR